MDCEEYINLVEVHIGFQGFLSMLVCAGRLRVSAQAREAIQVNPSRNEQG